MEAHRSARPAYVARERAEAAERLLGSVLVERADGPRDLRLDLARVAARRLVEDPRGGDGPPDALEPDAVQQLLAGTTSLCRDAQRLELPLRRRAS